MLIEVLSESTAQDDHQDKRQDTIDISSSGITLSVTDIYDGIAF
ncbi:hypothetical protein [Arsenicibacter rosenii]|nr:hypothetical protein [Arsenicibacter rosenii]